MSRTDARRSAAWSVRLLVVVGALAALTASAPEPAFAQATPTGEPSIRGDVPPPGSIALMVVGAQPMTRDTVVSDLATRGCVADTISITVDGEWRIYNPTAPDFAGAAFPEALEAGDPFAVFCGDESSGSAGNTAGNPGDGGAPEPMPEVVLPPRPEDTSTSLPYALQHVLFGRRQLDLLTTGAWAPYVHGDRDAFMIMSGNTVGNIDCKLLNQQAAELRGFYPSAPIYAATSGLANVRVGVTCLEPQLFSGLIMVYEPNQPNAPEFSWDPEVTEENIAELAQLASAHNLESWTKISGRATSGRDKFGEWDYAEFGAHITGQVIQTQGSCRDVDEDGDFVNGPREFAEAVESIRTMYGDAGVDTRVFVRVTASSDNGNPNAVRAEPAFECAEQAWSVPGIERVTLRTAVDEPSIQGGTLFLQMREELIP